MVHLKIHIHGRVQGVYYRASARKQAEELGLAGYVKNQPDGSVYAEVEGPEKAVAAFVDWCRQGPPLARVEAIRTETGDLQGFSEFTVSR